MSTEAALWEGNEMVAHERDHAPRATVLTWDPYRVRKELGFLTENQKTFVHNLSEKNLRNFTCSSE